MTRSPALRGGRGKETEDAVPVPTVSVLMATFNRAHLIGQAVKSVLAQTVSDWELIIADDGSQDDTPRVVREWAEKEPRIVSVRSPVNQGISRNYNCGLRRARGRYVAMIDDDDPWCDERKLEKQVALLDADSGIVGCGGGMICVGPDGKELYRYLKSQTDKEIRGRMLLANPMANSTTMFRREVGERVGFYDESFPFSGDRDFWLKMGLQGRLYNFPEYFSYYTITGHNVSLKMLRPHLKMSLQVMRKYQDRYPGYAAALAVNVTQYAYSFLPSAIRARIHESMRRFKRRAVG
jgi:hypothetical protein